MCWEFHGRDRVPLEDVGGTHGEDGGSREDHSPLGVRLPAKAVWRGFQLYVPKCTNGEGQAVHPIELPLLEITPDARLGL